MQTLITNIQGYSIHDGPGIRTVVFIKGCGLSCRWCANPETISPRAQTGFIENLCTRCGRCANVCQEGAINTGEAEHRIDYSRCVGCGACADACYYGALVCYGKLMSVNEVFDAVRRDKMFYADGGGTTVSGGEPLLQPEFVKALFELCKADGISTCIETSGFAPSKNLLSLLPLTDYLLFDIKHFSSEIHREYTGQHNDLILENARIAAHSGADILFRIPLIPTVGDSAENIRETAEFLKSIHPSPRVQLMPYHRMGDGKYKALGMQNTLRELEVMKSGRIEEVRQTFENYGTECSISK